MFISAVGHSGCGASIVERMLRTVGSLGRTGFRPSFLAVLSSFVRCNSEAGRSILGTILPFGDITLDSERVTSLLLVTLIRQFLTELFMTKSLYFPGILLCLRGRSSGFSSTS